MTKQIILDSGLLIAGDLNQWIRRSILGSLLTCPIFFPGKMNISWSPYENHGIIHSTVLSYIVTARGI